MCQIPGETVETASIPRSVYSIKIENLSHTYEQHSEINHNDSIERGPLGVVQILLY